MNGAAELLGYAHHHWARTLHETLATVPLPLHDQDAYLKYPQYRWMFNKLLLCQAQGIPAFPHGVEPADVGMQLPVFSKPITNLWGLSTGSRRVDEFTLADYRPGHFWMPLLEGGQLSTDVVVVDGRVQWSYSMEPVRDEHGSFAMWLSVPSAPAGVMRVIETWASRHLHDYRGVVNFETIGETIIEAPPRMAVQFIDFYGSRWLDAVADLYAKGTWSDPGAAAEAGVSYVLRLGASAADSRPRLRSRALVRALEQDGGVSIYLPWRDGQRIGDSNDDDHSFRLAVVNAPNVAYAEDAAAQLLQWIDGIVEDDTLERRPARTVRRARGRRAPRPVGAVGAR